MDAMEKNDYPKVTNLCVRFIYANYASQAPVAQICTAKIFIVPYITKDKMPE